jgi:hypothetical protein
VKAVAKQKNQEAKDWIGVAEKNFSPQLSKHAESLTKLVGWCAG